MLGPYGVQLRTPEVGQHFHGMGMSIAALPCLSLRNREVAILVTGARFEAPYPLDVHRRIEKEQGITEEEIGSILMGKQSETFHDEATAVWDASSALVNGSGRLSEEKWDRLVQLFSKEGAMHLVHLSGFHSYLCTVMNGFDAKVPT